MHVYNANIDSKDAYNGITRQVSSKCQLRHTGNEKNAEKSYHLKMKKEHSNLASVNFLGSIKSLLLILDFFQIYDFGNEKIDKK